LRTTSCLRRRSSRFTQTNFGRTISSISTGLGVRRDIQCWIKDKQANKCGLTNDSNQVYTFPRVQKNTFPHIVSFLVNRFQFFNRNVVSEISRSQGLNKVVDYSEGLPTWMPFTDSASGYPVIIIGKWRVRGPFNIRTWRFWQRWSADMNLSPVYVPSPVETVGGTRN
jgi:hypothetical protein